MLFLALYEFCEWCVTSTIFSLFYQKAFAFSGYWYFAVQSCFLEQFFQIKRLIELMLITRGK